jgi:TetR/AcrR family transcriptional repressor of nem operon
MTKAEKTRQYIIEQSAAIINRKGISGTSITDLMEATKLAKGGIYGNFENKEEICLEAFDYLASTAGRALETAISNLPTAKKKLFGLLEFYQYQVAMNERGGCPLLNFGLEADDTNEALRQRVAKGIKKVQQRMAKLVEEGKENGEFSSTVDSAHFALKMFVMIQGAMFTARVSNSPATMKTIVDILKKEIEAL